MSKSVNSVGDADFKSKVISSGKPALVFFWARWCSPCKMVFPSLETIAAENSKVEILSLDADDNSKTAADYSVASLPTLLMFKNGEIVGSLVGAASKANITNMIAKYV